MSDRRSRKLPGRSTAIPVEAHVYAWFVIERFGQEGERRHGAGSLTGAIDRFNGLACESKRLGVTRDGATVDLIVTANGAPRLNEDWRRDPRFAEDRVLSEAATRLRLGIAGLEQPRQQMGGMILG